MHKRVSSGTTILIVLFTLFLSLEPVLASPKPLSHNEPSRPSPRPQTQDGKPELKFSAITYKVGENQREAIITVELSPPSDGEVRVTYATYGKTVYDDTVYGQPMAMPGVDYEDTVGRLLFAPGETSKTFVVPILSDAEIEPDEIVYLELSKVVGDAILVGPSAFLTITDPAYNPFGVLQFSDVQYFVNEYHSSTPAPLTEQRTTTAVITVERTVGLSGTVSVDYATREQTAKADLDYDDVAGTLTFASGEATRTFTITVHDDLPTENDETLRLFLANPTGGATLGERDAAELTIVDVPAVHFDRSNYRFDEEAGEVEVLVNLTAPVREGEEIVVSCAEPAPPTATTTAASAPSTRPLPLTLPLGSLPAEGGTTATVPDAGYANEDATPGSDYTFSAQELRFLPGEQQKRVSLTINGDNDIEDDERLSLVLSIDEGRARLGTPSRTQITIQDNDGVSGGTLQFDRLSYEVAEGNAILITVERTGILSGTVSVRYATSDGTARDGEDYTRQNGMLLFSPGVSRATFGIATHYDGQSEGDETVHIRLSSPTGGATFAQTDTLLTIQDGSEAPPRALTVSSPFALPGQEVLFLATGGSSVKVSVGGQDEHLTLYDDGTHGDALAGDGLAATTWSVDGAGTVTATLYDNSGQETTKTAGLEIISDPSLLVLTDWRELYAEFQETGMAIDEDQDTDGLHDFYELVERIRQYADNHRGIVVDLPSAITPKRTFLYAYAALPYEGGVGDRYLKGLLVDQLINKLDTRAAHSFRNVAIVGDDQVVPFYRVFDPSNYFEQYYPGDSSPLRRGRNYIADIGGTRGNPVLEDLNQGYLLSDVPYSIRSLQYISEAAWYPQFFASKALPQPDMGIGRVLARRPLELVRAIDRYEEPLELRPDQARAALFVGDTSGAIELQDIADRSQKPLLETWFEDHAERLDIPDQSAWSAEDFRQALTERNLVSFVGGSAHYAYTIKSGDVPVRGYAPDLPAQTLEHPVLLVALGPCFGLSLSNAPDGAGLTRAYTETLVNALASVGATVLAPSSLAYLYTKDFSTPNLHELTTLLFIERLLNTPVSTTGEAWQELYAEFHRTDPALVETPFLSTQLFHIVAGYGMVLYGLPTQPVVRSATAARIEVTTTEQGAHNYQVAATVYDADNQPVAGTFVHFATNKGKITPAWSRTDETGRATATLSNTELLVGDFIITATSDTIDRQTTLNVSVASCTDGENNDTPGQSHDLPLNAVCQGEFSSTEEGTDDYYQVLMEQQSDLTLVLRDIPEGADYDLTIVDSISGETLAEAQHTNNQEERITLLNQRPGSYSVRVHLHQKPPSVSPATYTLTLLAPSATSPTLAGTMQNTRPISVVTPSGCTSWIRFTQRIYYVDENAGTAEISVAYDGDTSKPESVQYHVKAMDGERDADEHDFVPTNGMLEFDVGEYEETFTVTILNDAEVEYGHEAVYLSLDTPDGATCPGEPGAATLYIHDTTPRPSSEDLTISSPYVLSGGQQDPGGNETTVAVGQQVYVVATIDPQDAEGKAIDVCLPDDCAPLQDLQGSGVYAGFISPSLASAGNIELVLNVGGDPKRSQMLSVTDNPRTVILTDWNALYNEFLDTGMQPGSEDRNKNGLHDFFELVKRIRTYAEQHEGIVIDLPSAITTDNAFPQNYRDLNYGDNTGTRRQQGYLIDQLIEAVCTRSQETGATGCQNVVIIGSDQVVPFYRVFDPVDHYDFGKNIYDPDGGHSPERPPVGTPTSLNPLLDDLAQAYIPSDLPYSIRTFRAILPDHWKTKGHIETNWPDPDMGIGRIFAPTPHDLTAAIDQYETPLVLSHGKADASLLIGSDEALGHADFHPEHGEFAHKLFVRFFDRLKMPPTDSWNKEDVVQALSNDDLVSLWSHGSYNTIGVADPLPLTANDLGRVRQSHPLAFTAMACHSGISLSTYPDNGTPSIINTLANPLVARGITMFAPNGYAYSVEKKNLREHSTILHARRVERFTTALLEQETVGQAWVKSLEDYLDSDPATLETQNYAMNLFHLNGAYGMVLYGLPTQPIQQSGEREEAATVTCQPVPPPADGTLSPTREDSFEISLDIPRLTRQQDEGGGITFGLPHEGQQTGAPGGPVLPLLVRSLPLPDHLALKNIELLPPTAEDIRETISDITLTNVPVTAETITEDGRTTYSTGDDYKLPAIYPEIPYGFARPREENRLVTISAIPLQYKKESRTATLYQRMRFRVSLVPDTNAQEPTTAVSIPEGQAVYRNRYPQPVTVNVMHEQSDNLALHWTIKDGKGDVVESGQHLLTNEGQYQECTLKLNTHDWTPGNKDVHAAIQRGAAMLSSDSIQMMVKGISLEVESFEVPETYTPGWQATLALRLYREDGEPVSGLDSSAFTLSITDSKGNVHAVTPQVSEQPAATVGLTSGSGEQTSTEESIYTLTFSPPAEVQGDNNWLRVGVTLLEEGTEIVGDRTWALATPRHHVYLPLIIR